MIPLIHTLLHQTAHGGEEGIGAVQVALRSKGDFLYAPVSIAGRAPGWFILDTGSYRSYVTGQGFSRLKALGVHVGPKSELGPVPLSVGGRTLGIVSLALDTTGFPRSLDQGCDGVLGLDALSNHRIGLDLRRGVLQLWAAAEPIADVIASWSRTTKASAPRVWSTSLWPFGDRTFCVRVQVDNVSLPMCVDTGCVESYISRELGPEIEGAKSLGANRATFEFGESDIRYYRVRRYGIGGAWLAAKHPIGATQVTYVPGILGCDVLGAVRLLLDFSGQRVYMSSLSLKPDCLADRRSHVGTSLKLPTGVEIAYRPGQRVRVEPGCSFVPQPGSRSVRRADGTIDVVPARWVSSPRRPLRRVLLVSTVAGKACWQDGATRVPPGVPYTVAPGWRAERRYRGAIDLIPPGWQGERRTEGDFPRGYPPAARTAGAAR